MSNCGNMLFSCTLGLEEVERGLYSSLQTSSANLLSNLKCENRVTAIISCTKGACSCAVHYGPQGDVML